MKTPIKYGPHDKYVEVWGVESDSTPGKIYVVARKADDVWSCGCPRWTRNASRPQCKHISHVKQYRQQVQHQNMMSHAMPEQVKKALTRFSAIEI